jgi:predicted ATPase/class 3 adenylate cyclase
MDRLNCGPATAACRESKLLLPAAQAELSDRSGDRAQGSLDAQVLGGMVAWGVDTLQRISDRGKAGFNLLDRLSVAALAGSVLRRGCEPVDDGGDLAQVLRETEQRLGIHSANRHWRESSTAHRRCHAVSCDSQTERNSPEGTVTFMLTDIESSTRRWESNPAAMGAAMALHDELISAAVSEHRGQPVESGREGDSVLAVFPWAADAVAAAVQIQRSLQRAEWPDGEQLRIRIALNTGEAELRDGHYYGQAVYRCARLLAAGHGGQILLSLSTRQVVVDSLGEGISLIDHGEHRLNDLVRPERIYQLADEHASSDLRPIRSLDRRLTNLPIQLTTLVGRGEALAELENTLAATRLLTLTGAGGSGKTRLASELGARSTAAAPDGVWLVELAPLADGPSVAPAVARVLGLVEHPGRSVAESVIEQLSNRHLLLLLDNCEHLVGPVAELAERILMGCPRVNILATSREPLGIPGEVSWPVPPLAITDAVELFIGRARAHRPDLPVDGETAVTASAVCSRLDCLPLALELAAAQADALSLSEIASRLKDRFVLLSRGARTAPARQQTLRSTVEWSHNLLDQEERILLRRLSVFAGSFDLDSAVAVGAGAELSTPAVVPCLARLVKKSLVVTAEGRYRLHETVREFAGERLAGANEADAVARRLALHLLSAIERRAPGRMAEWLDKIELEQDNFKIALAWCIERDPLLACELAHGAFRFWNLRGQVAEGRDALAAVLANAPDKSAVSVECLIDSAAFAYLQGDRAEATAGLAVALAAGEAAGDDRLIGRALYMSGLVEAATGDPVRAEAYLEQALPLWQALSDGGMEAEILHQMGLLAGGRGELASAENLFRRSLDLRYLADSGDEAHITLTFLAAIKVSAGDLDAARSAVDESLEIGRRLGDRRASWTLDVSSWIAAADLEPERALILAGAAAAMHASAGTRPAAIWLALTTSFIDRARASLAAPEATAALERGRAMSFADAIDFALGVAPAELG